MTQLCHQIIHYNLGKTDYKIPSSEKTKTIDIKIKQKKPQYNLDTQTATIFALSSGNFSKDEFFH